MCVRVCVCVPCNSISRKTLGCRTKTWFVTQPQRRNRVWAIMGFQAKTAFSKPIQTWNCPFKLETSCKKHIKQIY